MKKDPLNVIIAIFVLALPFIINIDISDVLSIRYLALSILILLLYILDFRNGIIIDVLRSPIVIFLALLFFVNIISLFYHNFTADAIFSLSRLFILISLTFFFSSFFIKRDYLLIAKSILVFVLISILIYMDQIYISFLNEEDFMRSVETISSTMGNKNLLASILFLSLPFVFLVYRSVTRKISKILIILLLIKMLCILFIIQSKAVLLALLIMGSTIIFFTVRKNAKLIFSSILIIGMVTSMLFIASPQIVKHFNQEMDQLGRSVSSIYTKGLVGNNSRIALYTKTINMIKDNPLLGVGPGSWRKELPKYGLKDTIGEKGDKFVQRPHSDFLWFFAEGGMMSGILYILLFVFILKETLFFYLRIKDERRYFFLLLFSTILGYMVISLFDFPSERPAHNLFLSIILGIIISERFRGQGRYIPLRKIYAIILFCLFGANIVIANIRYGGDIHMSKSLEYKLNSDWSSMIGALDMAYHKELYDMDNTTTPLLWYYGLAYFNQGEVNKAFNYFKEAYEINPYHLHVINNLATCYGYNNDYTAAKGLYKDCIAISPRFEEAALNLAAIYSYEERNEKALDLLLDVRNFSLDSHIHLSDNYIKYVNTILLKIKDNNINTGLILSDDRRVFYRQIKSIYLKRQAKQSYKKIIQSSIL